MQAVEVGGTGRPAYHAVPRGCRARASTSYLGLPGPAPRWRRLNSFAKEETEASENGTYPSVPIS